VAYAPGRDARLPAVDERLVAPEAHAEIVEGRVYRTMGANEPHATEHTEVAHLLRACLAKGYRVAVDMLTRATKTTDAAPDVSIFPVERDPETGGRKIEEIAFEVADTESTAHATKKARKLAMRGVRRLFYVRVEDRLVHEWQHDTGTWGTLSPDAQIVDRCFALPIPVRALADEMLADETVVRVVLARRHPLVVAEIERGEARGEARGEVKGRRDALRALLRAMGLVTGAEDEARIEACDDAATLDRWIIAAAGASVLREVFGGDGA
jgi:Putative restriction endonuclease